MPVNPSGGLICKGEPIGASRLGQIFEIVTQIRGEADKRQVEEAKTGLTQWQLVIVYLIRRRKTK